PAARTRRERGRSGRVRAAGGADWPGRCPRVQHGFGQDEQRIHRLEYERAEPVGARRASVNAISVSMTDMTIMNTVPFAALCVAVVACVCDLRSRRIPNVLTFGAAAAAFAYHFTTGGVGALGQSALGWLVGVLVFIVPFALRGLGGGDVKLVAALGAWI